MPTSDELVIDSRSVPDQAAQILMQRILSGTFMPGHRIVESHVADELGIAQASVREALRKLEYAGVVEHKRYTGAVVKVSDPESSRLAIPIRAKIEEIAIVEAMRVNVDVGPLHDMVKLMLSAQGPDASAKTHTDFHHYICRASGQTMLAELWDLVIWRTSSLFLHEMPKNQLDPVVHSHEKIIAFIEAGDPAGAERLALDHVTGNLA